MSDTEKMLRKLVDLRRDFGTLPCLIAFAAWLKVEDERVLEMARIYVSRLKNPVREAPDWVRILANASCPSAILDAHDDLMADECVEV